MIKQIHASDITSIQVPLMITLTHLFHTIKHANSNSSTDTKNKNITPHIDGKTDTLTLL